jgi:ribonuclease P protein component
MAPQPRLGFAIAKKQLKHAVDRNRIKRLLRESFRQRQKDLPNRDVVVMVRNKILGLSNREIFARLDKHWQHMIKRCENS